MRFRRTDERLSKQSFLGAAYADVPGDRHVFDETGKELRVVCREDDIAAGGQHPAGIDAIALDHRDDRLGEIAPADEQIEIVFLELVVGLDARLGAQGFAVSERIGGAEIVAGGEIPAAAAHYEHADIAVRLRLRKARIDLVEHAIALRVAVFGTVERDGGYGPVGRIGDVLERHPILPARARA